MLKIKDIEAIRRYLRNSDIDCLENVSLKEFSYFRTGGKAKLIVSPKNKNDLKSFLRFMSGNRYQYKLVGDTSNLLFMDDHDYGVLVSLNKFTKLSYNKEDGEIIAEAGGSLPEFCRRALVFNLEGFEGLEGIPGTIGGGVFMNAGAYDSEIRDNLIEVRGMRADGSDFVLQKSDMEMTNRDSLFRRNKGEYIILEARFSAVVGKGDEIFKKMEIYHAKRHRYQDFLYPTLGSVFSTRDIYSDFGHDDIKYNFTLKLIRKFVYSKIFRKESPMNKGLLNEFVCRYFRWSYDVKPYSDKTMNCIANRGQHTDCFIEYIEQLREKLPKSVRLENEILDDFFFTEL